VTEEQKAESVRRNDFVLILTDSWRAIIGAEGSGKETETEQGRIAT
jgi:hypothetical protein